MDIEILGHLRESIGTMIRSGWPELRSAGQKTASYGDISNKLRNRHTWEMIFGGMVSNLGGIYIRIIDGIHEFELLVTAREFLC
jgi:hypothetical protein